MPQQTPQQLNNAMNPTPVTFKLPGEGQTFRGVGDTNAVYKIANGQLQNVGDSRTTANTHVVDSAGKVYNQGDEVTGDLHSIRSLDPGWTGYTTSTQSAAQRYQGFDALPEFNIADINSAIQQGHSFAPGTAPMTVNTPQPPGTPGTVPVPQGTPVPGGTPPAMPNMGGADPLAAQTAAMQSQGASPLANPNANYFQPGQGGNPTGTPTTPNAPTQGAPAPQMAALNNAASQGSPNLPQPPATPTVNSTAASPADNYLQQYLDSIKGQTNDPNMLATQQQLKAIEGQQADVNASRDLGIANVNEQPIAQSFLSGQSVALQNQAAAKMGALSAQAVPLQSQLASQQARLQSAVDVSKAALDYSQKQADINKPFNVAYGGSVYDPKTGQLAATNNPSSDPLISQAIQNGQLTPDMLTRYGASSVLSTLQSNPNFNFITGQADKAGTVAAATSGSTYKAGAIPGTYTQPNPVSTQSSSAGGGYQAGQLTKLLQGQGKPTDDASLAALYKQIGGQGTYANDTAHNSQIYSALGGSPSSGGSSTGGGSSVANAATTRANAAALTDQTKYLNNTQRAFTTAQQNLNSLIPFMQKAGVNSASTVPLINSIQKAVNGKLLDAGTIAAYQAGLAGLRAEYAQVLSRGGEVTEGQRAQAASLIPDNLTPAQLQQVADRLNIEGGNAVKEAQNQINSITSSLGGKSTSSSSSSAGDYQSYLKAIGQ